MFLRKALAGIYLAVISLYVEAASPTQYFWAVNWDVVITKAESPRESCQKRVDLLNSGMPASQRNQHIVSLKYHSPTQYLCYQAYEYYNDHPLVGGVWQTIYIKGATEIRRFGTSCQSDKNTNPTTGSCNDDEQKGPSNSCPSSFDGNPINFAVGNKFQAETDYSAGGNSLLSFSRNYNSLDGLWRHSFSTYLRFAGTQYVAVVMNHGRESFFTVSGATVTPTSAELGVLSKTDTGWQFVSVDNERFTFDTTGKLIQWSNARGAMHQLTYAGSQVSVTDNLGNSLSFTEDADHQPLTLASTDVQITYGYDANKRLISVARTAGNQTSQRQYHYEVAGKPNLLTGITDERGVRYATWSYDDKDRAISSEHADGADRIAVAYNSDGTVSVTNELGKVAKYSFGYIKGVKRITAIAGEPSANCPNSNSTFTYDAHGLLKTKTDNKGHLTTYDYNTRGLEVSRTEAAGTAQARTTNTEWHPTLFLPVTVTEPNRITTYTYDAQGRQLSQSVTQR
jgi:YD repeat-containing protein